MNLLIRFFLSKELHGNLNYIFPLGIRIIITSVAIDYITFGLTSPFTSYFIGSIMQNYALLGLFFGGIHFMIILLTFFVLELLKKYESRDILIIGDLFFIGSFLFLILSYFFSSWLIVFFMFFTAVGSTFRENAMRFYTIENMHKEYSTVVFGMAISMRNVSWLIGAFLSSIIIYVTMHKFGFDFLQSIVVLFILKIPILIFSLLRIFKIKKEEIKDKNYSINLNNFFSSISETYSVFKGLSGQLKFSMLLIFFFCVVDSTMMLFIPFLAIELGVPKNMIGILLGLMIAPYIFSAFFSIYESRHDKMNCIIVGLIFSFFPLLFLSIVSVPMWIGVLTALVSLCFSFINPANLSLISLHADHKHIDHIVALQIIFNRLGFLIGATFLGVIASKFGIKTAFLVISFLSVFFAIFALIIKNNLHLFPLKSKNDKNPHFHMHHIHSNVHH